MEMGELAGTEIATEAAVRQSGLHLVFVTGYADRIFGGYLQSWCGTPWWVHFIAWLDAVNQYWQGLGWGSRIF